MGKGLPQQAVKIENFLPLIYHVYFPSQNMVDCKVLPGHLSLLSRYLYFFIQVTGGQLAPTGGLKLIFISDTINYHLLN